MNWVFFFHLFFVRKYFLYIYCILLSLNSYGLEYILEYNKEKKVEENFVLKMKENKCTEIKIQKEIFKYKNKNKYEYFDIGNMIKMQTCYQKEEYTDSELNIVRWEDYIVKKGFILSIELEKRGCQNKQGEIFTKYVPHFTKKNYGNDYKKDVNIYKKGEKILLPVCENKINIVKKKNILPTKENIDIDVLYAVIDYNNSSKKEEYTLLNVDYFKNKKYINAVLGNLDLSLSLGYNINKFMYPFLSYSVENKLGGGVSIIYKNKLNHYILTYKKFKDIDFKEAKVRFLLNNDLSLLLGISKSEFYEDISTGFSFNF